MKNGREVSGSDRKKKQPNAQTSLIASAIIPVAWVLIMWAVHLYQYFTETNLAGYGIEPRTWSGLRGIIFGPFLHGDWSHLINNTYPMLFLGTGLFFFYRRSALKVLLFGTLVAGLWVWTGARPSFHIGASGVIYVLASFIFFSGIFTRNRRMIGLSLVTVFLYGGMVWGVFPIEERISWESHLFGGVAGLALAAVYRSEGPRKKKYSWDYDGDRSPIPEEIWNPEARTRSNEHESEKTTYVYWYQSKDKSNEDNRLE